MKKVLVFGGLTLLAVVAVTLFVVLGGDAKRQDEHAGHNCDHQHEGKSAPQAESAKEKCAPHGAPENLCYLCREDLREKGRLWCKEHTRYEDRCWLCHPELEDKKRLYCKEHFLYEDECFLCRPEARKGPAAHGEGDAGSHQDGCDGHGHGRAGSGHAHAANLALAEIEKRKCEHNIRTVDCQECRYELGVVKVQPSVTDALTRTETVREGALARMLRLTGEVQFDETGVVDVVPVGSGRIVRVNVRLGQRVKQGDVLAVIHSAEFGEAKAAYLEARAVLELARVAHEREKRLVASRVSSNADLEAAEREWKLANARLTAAEQRLYLFGLDHESVQAIDLSRGNSEFAQLNVRAPRSGLIVSQNVTEGRHVDTMHSLYTIAEPADLWVWCDLYERDLAALHEIMARGNKPAATVRVAAFTEAFTGVLDLFDSSLNEGSRTVKVRVSVKDEKEKLKPGMFATVDVALPGGDKAMLVPRGAVLNDEGRRFVFVHWKDDLWLRRDVEVGRTDGDLVEVLGGLESGARVVTGGGFMFKSDVLRAKMGAGCAD